MAKAVVKTAEVEARQYAGTGTFVIMNDLKGELHAKKGDWLIGNEKGKIDVLTDQEFRAKYDLDGDLTSDDLVPAVQPQSPLVDPVFGAAPHKGIVPPDASSTRDSQPVPGFIDDSKVPLSDKNTPVKLSTPSNPLPAKGAAVPISSAASSAIVSPSEKVVGSNIETEGTEEITVKSDSTLLLEKGGTVAVGDASTGTVLTGGWEIEHISTAGDETTLTLKKK